MTLQGAAQEQLNLLSTLGKSGLNLLHPNEFELYLCALELTDQNGNTLKYFVFPVMPSGIDENLPQLTNIKKTMAGVTVLSSPTFNPTDISLAGNFGRKFKVLLGTDATELISSFTTADGSLTKQSVLGGAANFFDNRIKTGYGCIKILQDIIEQSQQVDSKGIRRLIFYNLALGNSYLVKAINLRFSQSQESNMIWNYNLQLKSIAPLSAIMTSQQIKQQQFRLVTTGFAQKAADVLLNSLSSILSSGAIRGDRFINKNINEPLKNGRDKLKNQIIKKWR